VSVSATNNVGVTSVSLSVDGSTLGAVAASPYAFAWNTASAANGSHILIATASDAAGNAMSSSVTVMVSNNVVVDSTAPTVVITSPAAGSTVSTNVTVSVNAADNVGVIKNELYVDGVLTSTASAAPFTNKWNTRKAKTGAHVLQCKAYDAAGNFGWSQTVSVNK
jgi:hypothetical protein